MSRTIIIGDIHGCFDELGALLESVAPTADDQIIAIGDIVDRGPQNEKVLEFFRDTPNAISIMGNHERKHIRSARGEISPALSQLITREEVGERYGDWLKFMERFPRYMELPEAILVHGFYEPGVPLEQQRDTVVIGTLSGEKYLQETYPSPWYDQYSGPKPLVFGHHDYLGTGEPLIREGFAYGIDTGCPYGGRLTALVLPGFQIVQVPSRGNHWSATRLRHARLHAPRDLSGVNWPRLVELAGECENATHGEPCEGNLRAAVMLAESRRVAHLVAVHVQNRCAAIIAMLAESPDWHRCSTRQQAAQFSGSISEERDALLLYRARQGRLDANAVMQFSKSPRELFQLAHRLGISTKTSGLVGDQDGSFGEGDGADDSGESWDNNPKSSE
jgi:serine/threonine protein phosphatase 1